MGTAVSGGLAFLVPLMWVGIMRPDKRNPCSWGISKALGQIGQGSASPAPGFCTHTPSLPPPSRGKVGEVEGAEQGWHRGTRLTGCKEQDGPGHLFSRVWPGNLAETSAAHGSLPAPPVRPEQGKKNQG